jgi:hypothetical protein
MLTREEIERKLAEHAPKPKKPNGSADPGKTGTVVELSMAKPKPRWPSISIQTAHQLKTKTFPPLKHLVPDLICEGLVLLAGKPKVRKSWMALDTGLAVAAGRFCLGDRKCVEGEALYLALEDGERRLQRRMDKVLPTGSDWPGKFYYSTQWPRADQGGVEAIDAWCEEHPAARLVVIDILAKFRAPSRGQVNVYEQDYAALSRLQELAVRRGITIIVVHHTRKGDSEDPVEEISGSLGLAGSCDAFLVLKRATVGATLVGRGRDAEDVDLAVQWSDENSRWTIVGSAAEVRQSEQRAAVKEALSSSPEGLSTAEIMAAAHLANRNAADALLFRMAKEGAINRVKAGFYSLLTTPPPKTA